MKTNFLAVLAVAALPVISGCAQSTAATEGGVAAPGPAVTNAVATDPEPVVVAPAAIPTGQVVNTAPVIPDTIKLTPSAAELAKLAQAGISPGVMVAYVTNSVHTFNLGADEIVYLNDLGLAPEVVTAMIHHDQRIREASLQGAVAASPATPQPGTSLWANNVPEQSNVWQQPATEPAPVATEAAALAPPPEQPPSQVTVNYFYDSLSPYGTWIDVEGYGRVWRPTVAVSVNGWRPYEHGGRWMWTDHGWYWYSDYSWGWAPFHYGRWFTHPHWGWCWVPDTVWGPSWVSWRYSDSYYGWAPLPPAAYYRPGFGYSYYGSSVGVSFGFGLSWSHYTFVSYRHFHGRHYDRYCAPRHETPRIYQNTTVVNNIITGNNNTIINQGLAPDRITAITRTEVPRVRIHETTLADNRGPRGGRQEQLAPDGRTLAVTRNVVPGTTLGGPGRGPRNESSSSAAAPASATTPTPSAPSRNETVRGPQGTPRNIPTTVGNAPTRMAPIREVANAPSATAGASAPAGLGRGDESSSSAAAPASATTPTPSAPSRNETVRGPQGTPRNIPATVGNAPTRMAPIREVANAPSTTAGASAPAGPGRVEPPGNPRPERNVNDRTVTAATPPVATPPAATSPAAGSTPRASEPRTVTPSVPSNVLSQTPDGRSVIYINPRTGRQTAPATASSGGVKPADTRATPWLNNPPNTAPAAPAVTPAPSTPAAPPAVVRDHRTPSVTRNSPVYNQGTPRSVNSSTWTPPASTPAPTRVNPRAVETPAAPRIQNSTPRTFGAPAPPQRAQTYSPPVRTSEPRAASPPPTVRSSEPRPAAPSAPARSYSPPARSSEPRSVSPPPSAPSSRPSPPARSESGSANNRSRNDR